jgi:iron complex transport system ATP-binding protein
MREVLSAKQLSLGYGRKLLIRDLDIAFADDQITALVGPNGSGKSTLLKGLARILGPKQGAVYLDGKDINRLPTREVARQMAVLPQAPAAPAEVTVRELVEQGRFPHVGALRMLRHQDDEKIAEALRLTRLEGLEHRAVDELSGGERQRAWIALVLAQDTSILLLDEPTTYLDIGYQLEVLELIASLRRDRHMTVVMVLHDLNHAARYAERMVVMNNGRIVSSGSPDEVITDRLLREVFRVRASITRDPRSHSVLVLPYEPEGNAEDALHEEEVVDGARPRSR